MLGEGLGQVLGEGLGLGYVGIRPMKGKERKKKEKREKREKTKNMRVGLIATWTSHQHLTSILIPFDHFNYDRG